MRSSKSPHIWLLIALSVGTAAHGQTAPAAAVDPVALTVTPRAGSWRWIFRLKNRTPNALDVVADRRLLRTELVSEAPTTTPPPTRRRAARMRLRRCLGAGVGNLELSPRVTLAPGAAHTEEFDLRELCGLQPPSWVAPGNRLRFSYGLNGRASFSRVVVRDGSETPRSLIEGAEVLFPQGNWPPTLPPTAGGDARLQLTVAGRRDAAIGAGLTLTVRARGTEPYPLPLLFRSGLVRLRGFSPQEEPLNCSFGPRDYPAMRELFVRVDRRRSVSAQVRPAYLCPTNALDQPGIYRFFATYATQTSGAEVGLRGFTGEARSGWFEVRIGRGATNAAYRPLPSTAASTRETASQTSN